MVQAPKGYFCILHVMEFKWDRSGKIKNGIGGSDAELIKVWPGLQFDNTRDYINWGFSATADKFPADVMELRGDDLARLVAEMTPDWHPNLRRLFELTEPSTCFPINIKTSLPHRSLAGLQCHADRRRDPYHDAGARRGCEHRAA